MNRADVTYPAFVDEDPTDSLPEEVDVSVTSKAIQFMTGSGPSKKVVKHYKRRHVQSFQGTVDPKFMDLFTFKIKHIGEFALEVETMTPILAAFERTAPNADDGFGGAPS